MMNQPSWRRILESVDHDVHGESSASIINMRERAEGRRGGRAQTPSPAATLDYELSQALDKASRKHRDAEPTRLRPVAPLPARNPYALVPAAPLPPRPMPRKHSGGVKNVIAIALSVTVVGVAFHQISAQWSEAHNSAAIDEASSGTEQRPGAAFYTATVAAPQKREGGNVAAAASASTGDGLSLRPSFAQQTDAKVEDKRQALYQDMDQEAVDIFLQWEGKGKTPAAGPASQKGVAHARLSAAPEANSSEQALLHRGKELMKRGNVAGARLIFEHLADEQSALAAFALAQTYDADFLKQLGIEGAKPDDSLAAQWYQRAADLTKTPAERR